MGDQEEDYEIGILSFSQLYDLEMLSARRDFFRQVEFVLMLEPSLILATGQVGLSLVVNYCDEGERHPTYCMCDRNCDGLVDTLSHMIKQSITIVSATETPTCLHSEMCWAADGPYLHQRIMPDISPVSYTHLDVYKRQMEDHNRCMHETLREVQNSAQHYTGYLSALCSYLRGRSYLDQERWLRSTQANQAQLSRGHRRAIAKCCALVRSWGGALGATVEPGLGDKPPAFDAAVAPEENLAYRFPTRNQGRRIPLNQTGETMFSPRCV